jgi:hypothetical protein
MLVLINDWNRLFYDALQNKQQDVFWTQLGRFTWIAFAYIIIAVYKFYLTQLLELRWRAWLTGHYTTRWLANHAFYRMELARFTQPEGATGKGTSPDNPDQRIQEDLNLFTSYSVSLSMGLLNALVTPGQFRRHSVGAERRVRLQVQRRQLRNSGIHGLDGGAVLRGRQRAHPLHRPPADSSELPAAARGSRLSPPHGAGARVQRVHRPGQGRSRGAQASSTGASAK